MFRVLLSSLVAAGCVQKPPHANVVLFAERVPAGHAVLVMPTSCTTHANVDLCTPSTIVATNRMQPVEPTWGGYIDPALRLKLEFAGFTLAEAAVMRIQTAGRVEINDAVTIEEGAGPQTVAELGDDDVRAVATSLGITGLVVPTLTFKPAPYAATYGELVISLVDVATKEPRWTVSCVEEFYGVDSANRLANCASNGVLAVLAPGNLIGKAL